MEDIILEALESKKLNKNNISFSSVREIAGRDYGIWHELGRGRSILLSEKHLDQYLYSYGLMIQSQWDFVFSTIFDNGLPQGEIQVIDYACGQGLASIFLHDIFLESDLGRITSINLIEPSVVALTRAKGLIKCCYPGVYINCVNKLLDDFQECEVTLSSEAVKVHLFSHILDIDGFDQFDLLCKALSTASGRHLFLAVSHDREHNGGSSRLRELYDFLLCDEMTKHYKVFKNDIAQFNYGVSKPTIVFYIDLEV